MTTLGRLSATLLCSAVLGCSTMRDQPLPPERVTGPTTPADLDRVFGERVNAGDVEGLVALYEPNAALLREDGSAAVGHEAIRKELQGLAGSNTRIVMGVGRVVTADDVALVENDWNASATDPKGKAVSLSGRATEVMRRQGDGTWRYVIDDPYARSRRAAKKETPPRRRSKRR